MWICKKKFKKKHFPRGSNVAGLKWARGSSGPGLKWAGAQVGRGSSGPGLKRVRGSSGPGAQRGLSHDIHCRKKFDDICIKCTNIEVLGAQLVAIFKLFAWALNYYSSWIETRAFKCFVWPIESFCILVQTFSIIHDLNDLVRYAKCLNIYWSWAPKTSILVNISL